MQAYSFELETKKSPAEVFALLLDVEKWWSGIYGETISGKSRDLQDEFTFSAGGGMHFTRQRLVEKEQDSKLVWEVVESNLSFLEDPKEWEHTRLRFDITGQGTTKLRFTHEGLVPAIACYNQCSSAWTQYFSNLRTKLTE